MTGPPPPPGWDTAPEPASWFPAPVPTPGARARWRSAPELRAAGVVAVTLVVVGVIAGVGWWQWSPARGIALALGPHVLIPDETEAFVAADGRFAVITAALGLVAGFGAFAWRRVRGPVVAAGLAVGALLGSLATALVGYWFGGGAAGGTANTVITPHLELRMTGLLLLEAVVALLVYGLLATMSARDDLGAGDAPADDPPELLAAQRR